LPPNPSSNKKSKEEDELEEELAVAKRASAEKARAAKRNKKISEYTKPFNFHLPPNVSLFFQ
jgi:hypothetical protein